MFCIKIADLIVKIEHKYPDVCHMCKDYIVESETADIHISVTEDDLKEEAKQSEYQYSPGYLETVCIYRKICLQLPGFHRFLLHASVLKVEGLGIALLGRSGIGKTTQTNLWLNCFGSRAHVVNGDKPIIRCIKEGDSVQFFAYGTPWCGKEGMQTNTFVEIKAMVFLEQAKENHIRSLTPEEWTEGLFHQCLMPKEPEKMSEFLELCDGLIRTVPAYLLSSRPNEAAVQMTWDTVQKKVRK